MGHEYLVSRGLHPYDAQLLLPHPPAAHEVGIPLPMGRTGPGLYGKAPVFNGLGALTWRSVAIEPH